MTRRLLTLFLLSFSLAVQAQVNEVPVHFGLLFHHPLVNPAQGGYDANLEVSLGGKRNIGNFGGIQTSFAAIYTRLPSGTDNFHVVGFQVNKDIEGPVLRRNRAYLSYSRHLQLSEQWYLSAGMSGGFYNYAIKSNPITGSASSSAVDGNIGVFLYREQTQVGFSIHQITQGTVMPVEQEIKLIPQYMFVAKQSFAMTEKSLISPSFFYRYSDMKDRTNKSRVGLGLNIILSDLVDVGMRYESSEGWYTTFGLRDLVLSKKEKGNHAFNIDMAYFIPKIGNMRTNVHSFELILRYCIKENNE